MPLEVDTYDWDTAFAIRYADANSAISNGWAQVAAGAKSVSVSNSGYTLTATLGPWLGSQLTVKTYKEGC